MMFTWWAFPLFFSILSSVVVLLSLLADSLTNSYPDQRVAHFFVWLMTLAINLAVWLIWVLIYK